MCNCAFMAKPIEWTQDINSITLTLELKRTTKPKINVNVYSNMVKISIPDRNWITFIDLNNRVNFTEFKDFSYDGNSLSLCLRKEIPAIWDSLEPDNVSKEELKAKRQAAMKEKEDSENLKLKKIVEIREDINSKALDNKLDQDREHRNEIERAKNEEKTRAIEAVIDIKKEKVEEVDVDEPLFSETDKARLANKIGGQYQHTQASVRQAPNEPIQMTFTKKVYPHLAMRDKYLFEPPKPRKSELDKDTDAVDVLWLKDKGDEFLRNKDFDSALRAYNEALKAKPDMLGSIANKSLLLLMKGDMEGSLDLVEYFERVFSELSMNEKNYTNNRRIKDVIAKRKIFLLMNMGKTPEALQSLKRFSKEETIINEDIGEEELTKMKHKGVKLEEDSKSLELRIRSNKVKQQADIEFSSKNYSLAVNLYEQALDIDASNEKAISNLAQLYIKQCHADKALEVLEKLAVLVNNYKSQFSSLEVESNFKTFLTKLYMRYIKVYKMTNQRDRIKEFCKALLKLDEHSNFVKRELKELKINENKSKYFELKDAFKNLLANKEYREALAILKQSSEFIEFEDDPVEVICLNLNKTVCYNALGSHYETIGETLKSFKMIRNLESNILNKELRLKYEQNKAKLKDLEIRLYVRRANAFVQTGQFVSAKQDLEKAKALDPDNAEILGLLETVNKA